MGAWGGETRQDWNTAESNPHGWIRIDERRSGVMAGSNGTTGFGKVLALTVMGLIAATNLLRPIGKAVLTAISTASTTITVGVNNIKTIFVGDVLGLISTTGVLGYIAIPDLDGTPASGETIDVNGTQYDGLAHKVILADPSANSSPLFTGITIAAGVATITVSLETDGAGALISTIDEVIAEINASAAAYVNATLAGGATGSTVIVVGAIGTFTLAGQVATGGAIDASLTVVSVDLAAGTMVVDSAVTAAIGDVIKTTDGSDVAVGILINGVDTLVHKPDGDADEEQACLRSSAGVLVEGQVCGLNDLVKAELPAIVFRP